MRNHPEKLGGNVYLFSDDCLLALDKLKPNSIDSCCCDPPYHLQSIVKRFGGKNAAPAQHGRDGAFARASKGFMSKQWDGGDIAFRKEMWQKVYRVLKPGAHLVAFCGTRNYHRLACAIEDAGFEIRDSLLWLYGSGFPKSHDVSKAIDRAAGAEREVVGFREYAGGHIIQRSSADKLAPPIGTFVRSQDDRLETAPATPAAAQWEGWGTALKPAVEIICLARKPLSEGTVAANVLKWGTGAINIDECRVSSSGPSPSINRREIARRTGNAPGHPGVPDGLVSNVMTNSISPERYTAARPSETLGRFPANVAHDGSDEVVAAFPNAAGQQGNITGLEPSNKTNNVYGHFNGRAAAKTRRKRNANGGVTNFAMTSGFAHGDSGSAARFFYTAKADSDDRLGFNHPTVKPVDLMQWLVRLVTPKGGWVLDCFAGTGTTAEAAWREKCKTVLIEKDPAYQKMIRQRVKVMQQGKYAREVSKMQRTKPQPGALFANK